jgi:hypothetical protein
MSEFPAADFIICKYRISKDCLKMAHCKEFSGFFCGPCKKQYYDNWYQAHKQQIISKVMSKYVPSGKPRGRPRKQVPYKSDEELNGMYQELELKLKQPHPTEKPVVQDDDETELTEIEPKKKVVLKKKVPKTGFKKLSQVKPETKE